MTAVDPPPVPRATFPSPSRFRLAPARPTGRLELHYLVTVLTIFCRELHPRAPGRFDAGTRLRPLVVYVIQNTRVLSTRVENRPRSRLSPRRSAGSRSRRKRLTDVTPFPRLKVEPLDANVGLRQRASDAIKRAITQMDIYGHDGEIRLDERQLSQDLGVSR